MNEDLANAWQALDGVKVVELGTSVAAPYAAWIMGSLGADVISSPS